MSTESELGRSIHKMKIKQTIPWICVLVLFLTLVLFGIDILKAYQGFGHIPQYLQDADPFHTDVQFWFPNLTFTLYLLSPVILIVSVILLANPWTFYRGKHRVVFHISAIIISLSHYLLFWQDVTGFVNWCVD